MGKAAGQTRLTLKPVLQASQPAKVGDSSFMEASDDFDFGSSDRGLNTPTGKRKSTVGTDPEDHALRTKAWAGNRGFVSYSLSTFLLPLVVLHGFYDTSLL